MTISEIYPGPGEEVAGDVVPLSARGPVDATAAKFLIGNGRVPIVGTRNAITGKWHATLDTTVPLNGATGGQEPRSVSDFAAVLTVVFEGPHPETSEPHWFFVMKTGDPAPTVPFAWRPALEFGPAPMTSPTAYTNYYGSNGKGSGAWGMPMTSIVDDPLDASRKVLRVRLDPNGDIGSQPNTSGLRYQGQSATVIGEGDDFYVYVSFLFPDDFPVIPDQPGHVNLFQIFGRDKWGTGELGEPVDPNRKPGDYNGFGAPLVIAAEPLRRADGTYYDIDRVRTGGNSQNPGLPVPIVSVPINRGKEWLGVVLHIKASRDPRRGSIQAWLDNGEYLTPVRYPVAYPGTDDHYTLPFVLLTKWHGLLRSDGQAYVNRKNNPTLPLTVFLSGHAQGPTLASVTDARPVRSTGLGSYMRDSRGNRLDEMEVLSAEEVDERASTAASTAVEPVALSTQQAIALAEASAPSMLDVMPSYAQADALTSATSARAAFEDSTTITEMWDDTSAWTLSDFAVDAANDVAGYKGSGTNYWAARAFPLGSTGVGRLRASIVVPAAGGTGTSHVQVGITGGGLAAKAAGGAAFSSGAADSDTTYALAIGFTGGTNRISFFQGANVGGSGSTATETTTLDPGIYEVSIVIDEQWISISLVNADHTLFESARRIPRSTFGAINNVVVRASDSRGLAGVRLLPIQYRNAISSFTPRTKETKPWYQYSVPAGETTSRVRVAVPASYDSRKPMPMILCPHGRGGDIFSQTSPGTTNGSPIAAAFWDQIVAAGFIVVHSDGASPTEYGSDASLPAYLHPYQHARDHFAISSVVIASTSMGGVAGLRLITDGVIPAAGFFGMAPVVSLRAQYDAGGGRDAEIRAAFGIASNGSDYDAKTDGKDPALLPASRFRGLPYLIRTAAADATVNPVQNANVLRDKLAGKVREFKIETVSGTAHLPEGVYNPATVIPFLKRAVRS